MNRVSCLQDLEFCEKRGELASCAGEPRFKLWNARKRRKLKTVASDLGDIIIVGLFKHLNLVLLVLFMQPFNLT